MIVKGCEDTEKAVVGLRPCQSVASNILKFTEKGKVPGLQITSYFMKAQRTPQTRQENKATCCCIHAEKQLSIQSFPQKTNFGAVLGRQDNH